MVVKEENEPLLMVDGNNRKTGRYDSLNNGSNGNDTAIPLESKVRPSDLFLKPGYTKFDDNGRIGNGGGSSPDSPLLLSQTEDVTFAWRDVNVHVQPERSCAASLRKWLTCRSGSTRSPGVHIIQNVTGIAYPGELLAIMGASGSGKTTLLNALTFKTSRKLAVTGRISVNGEPINDNGLTSISAYVQQDDLFIGTLTVKEHLIFQALVRMDKKLSYESRMRRVEEVMAELTLTKCQNTVIGIPGKLKGISGGEMKRLSFASEVLTNPPLMFCDEPTSGLDSFMAQNVVTVLKNLASKGKTIITTIHQPSSEVYNMFDKIILMAAGRLAFLGTPSQANDFFRTLGAPCPVNHNPADHFIHLLAVVPSREETCRNMIGLVCDSYRTSPIGVEMSYKAESFTVKTHSKWYNQRRVSPYKATWCTQFRALLWRSWLSILKEPELVKGRLFQTVMVALIIGVLYFGQTIDQDGVMNINGALFVCLSNMTFQNMFSVIHVFCSELPVFLREHLSGMYRTDVYFLTKTMAEVPIFIAIPVLFTSIIYFMIGLNPSFLKFVIAMFVMVLISNAASSFGYFISSISSNISVALSIGPPIVIPFLLFGGFLLNAGSVPPYLKWLSDLSWYKYGNEALLINQWEDIADIACTRANSTCPADGHVVLETYNFNESNLLLDFFALAAIITGFRLLAFSGLLSRSYLGH